MSPLVWLYSPRTSRWVAFVADVGHTIRPHPCRGEPSGWPSWRESRRGTPPSAEYLAVRQQLKNRTGEHPDLRDTSDVKKETR